MLTGGSCGPPRRTFRLAHPAIGVARLAERLEVGQVFRTG